MNSSPAALVFDGTTSAAILHQYPKVVMRRTRRYLPVLKSGLMICMFEACSLVELPKMPQNVLTLIQGTDVPLRDNGV
jgi:hypothetical protein